MRRRHTAAEENLLARRLKLDQEVRRRSDPMGERETWNERKGRPEFVSRKRHPLDCGNSRCGICSQHKRFGHEPTRQEIVADIKLDEAS